MKKLIALLAVLIATFLVFAAWESFVFLNRSPHHDEPSDRRATFFEVKRGESFRSVSQRLEREGLVSSSWKFHLFARLTRQTGLRAGEYALKATMFPNEVIKILTSGRSVGHSFTVQEGLNKFEIAELFERKGLGRKSEFLRLVEDPKLIRRLLQEDRPSLEGYLFPETYKVTKYTGALGLIEKMVENFNKVYQTIDSHSRVGLSRHELVILASIIEKETGAEEEREVISSVYHNRLNKPMRLQADPTVLYGIWVETGRYKSNITKRDLRQKTPYNTYTNNGLPFGPIANPGRESLRAAANPEQTKFLYFVSRNDGTHVFSIDYSSHLQAVRRYQLDRRARQGKSWRDLNKRVRSTN